MALPLRWGSGDPLHRHGPSHPAAKARPEPPARVSRSREARPLTQDSPWAPAWGQSPRGPAGCRRPPRRKRPRDSPHTRRGQGGERRTPRALPRGATHGRPGPAGFTAPMPGAARLSTAQPERRWCRQPASWATPSASRSFGGDQRPRGLGITKHWGLLPAHHPWGNLNWPQPPRHQF